jgi:hypothetical protein
MGTHSLNGPRYCGYCLTLFLERYNLLEEFGHLVDAVSLARKSKEDLRGYLADHPLGVFEISFVLWEWHLRYWEKMDTLSFLTQLNISEINNAIREMKKYCLSLEVDSILEQEIGERRIAQFLDENHHILRASTGYYHPGDCGHCLKEYRLGSDFVADFLIINSRRSLAPIITLVELEPVEDNLFTKKGFLPNDWQLDCAKLKNGLFGYSKTGNIS